MFQITLYQQTYSSTRSPFNDGWDSPRRRTSSFVLLPAANRGSGENVAEEVFHALNAPVELLDRKQDEIATLHRKGRYPSLSVGDVVQVSTAYGSSFYLCESFSWAEADSAQLALLFQNLVFDEALRFSPNPEPEPEPAIRNRG